MHGPIRKSPNYQSVYYTWFCSTWGSTAALAFNDEWLGHINGKRGVDELEALLAHHDELYQNRLYVALDMSALVQAGYYGDIIKASLNIGN